MTTSKRAKAVLEIRPPEPERDRASMVDLAERVSSAGNLGHYGFVEHCRKGYIDGSAYDWRSSVIGLVGGEVVTHYGVWRYAMRVGRAGLVAGGIGAVGTAGSYRDQGFMARTATESLALMRANGYHVSVLFGIRDFYHRFGYVRAWNDESYIVAVADLPTPSRAPGARPLQIRAPITAATWRLLGELYNAEYAGLTGTAVRPTYTANRFPELSCFVWPSVSRPHGYVLLKRSGQECLCWESIGEPERALGAARFVEERWGCKRVRFEFTHHLHPVTAALRRGEARRETEFHANSGPLICLLDLQGALRTLCPELGRRLEQSEYRDWIGRISVKEGEAACTLQIARSHVRVLDEGAGRTATDGSVLGSGALVQLLIGTDEPAEIVAGGGVALRGPARDLAAALFPAQRPSMSLWDRF